MSHLYVNGEATLYASEEEAIAKMKALIKKLKGEGYTSAPHPTDENRFTLTHATKGFVEVYVHDDPPEDDEE